MEQGKLIEKFQSSFDDAKVQEKQIYDNKRTLRLCPGCDTMKLIKNKDKLCSCCRQELNGD